MGLAQKLPHDNSVFLKPSEKILNRIVRPVGGGCGGRKDLLFTGFDARNMHIFVCKQQFHGDNFIFFFKLRDESSHGVCEL